MGARLFYLKGVNGQLEVYDDKVIISRKGVMGFISQGLAGDKTIPMHAIQSIQFKEGNVLTNGFIQFAVLGGRERQGGVFTATQDENTIMLKMGEQSRIGAQIKEHIEKRISNTYKPQAPQTVIQKESDADELIKFKKLLDTGVITQDEFNAKKKQLLGL